MNLINEIDIESRFTPKIAIQNPLSPSVTPNIWLDLLKPKITITTPLGTQPIVSAPWGDPGASKWPVVQFVGVTVASFLVLRKLKRRR